MLENVSVEQGMLAGIRGVDGRSISFKGIPYAAPPVGDLRWKRPQPPRPWDGVRPAVDFPLASFQPMRPSNALTYTGDTMFSEDCLYLNVWSSADNADERRPVMVWFHLGAYVMGSGSASLWDGEALSEKGVVVVTLNWRLGRLGFLAHPDLSAETLEGVSGNYGLLDQIEALKWVQRNIAAFGGDPSNVTIFGQSSGSASVSILMASKLGRGLFHKAIGQSGGAFESPRPNDGFPNLSKLSDAERDGVALQEYLGARSIDDMRTVSAERLLGAFEGDDTVSWRTGVSNSVFRCAYPVIDGFVVPETGILDVFENGEQCDVPLISGSTSHEGGGKLWMPDLESYERAVREDFGPLADRFFALYPAETDAEAVRVGSIVLGDRFFSWQNWIWANTHSRTSTSPVFYYYFAHVPPFPPGVQWAETNGDPTTELGAMHGMDLPYIFDNLKARDWPWRPEDRLVADQMSDYWVNFARSGNPNGAGLPTWETFDGQRTLRFDGKAEMTVAPDRERMAFWTEYFLRCAT